MICDSCKNENLDIYEINNENICYKCAYQKKLEKTPENRMRKTVFCRCCGKEVAHQENLKKRQRTVFCSPQCAKVGHKQLINNHWTRKVRSGRVTNGT